MCPDLDKWPPRDDDAPPRIGLSEDGTGIRQSNYFFFCFLQKRREGHGGLESPSRVEVRHLPAPLPRGVESPPGRARRGAARASSGGLPRTPPPRREPLPKELGEMQRALSDPQARGFQDTLRPSQGSSWWDRWLCTRRRLSHLRFYTAISTGVSPAAQKCVTLCA